jgi:hypothetical protein
MREPRYHPYQALDGAVTLADRADFGWAVQTRCFDCRHIADAALDGLSETIKIADLSRRRICAACGSKRVSPQLKDATD